MILNCDRFFSRFFFLFLLLRYDNFSFVIPIILGKVCVCDTRSMIFSVVDSSSSYKLPKFFMFKSTTLKKLNPLLTVFLIYRVAKSASIFSSRDLT